MTTAAKYRRLSSEKDEQEDSDNALARQDEDCEELARSQGCEENQDYCDPSSSAYKEDVFRPAFEQMLLDLPKLDALVVYDIDRLTRDPETMERVIRVFKDNPHLRFFTCSGEDMDLSTEAGREAARYACLAARREARRASERQTRKHRQRRDSGRIAGSHRPFGLMADRQTLNLKEVTAIRAAATDLLIGKPLRQIVREWSKEGLLTTTGGEWKSVTLRNLLLSPRMAGYLVQTPKRVKGQPVAPRPEWIAKHSRTKQPIMALHPPILADDHDQALAIWQLVVAELTGRRARQSIRATSAASYPLSGLMVATKCAGPMQGNWLKNKGRHSYKCEDGCTSIHGPDADAEVIRLLKLHWANQPTVVLEPEPFSGQLALDNEEAELARLKAAYDSGRMDLDDYLERSDPKKAWIASLKAQRQAWLREQVQDVPVGSLELFDGADETGQRLMIRQEISRVDVGPAQRGLKVFSPGRLKVNWR